MGCSVKTGSKLLFLEGVGTIEVDTWKTNDQAWSTRCISLLKAM